MRKWLNDIFTGADNATHDLGRWSWAGSFLAVVACAAWRAFKGAEVDLMVLAQALGVVCTTHGIALFTKQKTEPTP